MSWMEAATTVRLRGVVLWLFNLKRKRRRNEMKWNAMMNDAQTEWAKCLFIFSIELMPSRSIDSSISSNAAWESRFYINKWIRNFIQNFRISHPHTHTHKGGVSRRIILHRISKSRFFNFRWQQWELRIIPSRQATVSWRFNFIIWLFTHDDDEWASERTDERCNAYFKPDGNEIISSCQHFFLFFSNSWWKRSAAWVGGWHELSMKHLRYSESDNPCLSIYLPLWLTAKWMALVSDS